jgi:hypothetical protein
MKIIRWVILLTTRFKIGRSDKDGDTPSVDHLVTKRKVKDSTYLQSLVSAGVLEGAQSPVSMRSFT